MSGARAGARHWVRVRCRLSLSAYTQEACGKKHACNLWCFSEQTTRSPATAKATAAEQTKNFMKRTTYSLYICMYVYVGYAGERISNGEWHICTWDRMFKHSYGQNVRKLFDNSILQLFSRNIWMAKYTKMLWLMKTACSLLCRNIIRLNNLLNKRMLWKVRQSWQQIQKFFLNNLIHQIFSEYTQVIYLSFHRICFVFLRQ